MWTCKQATNACSALMWFYKMSMFPVAPLALLFTLTTQSKINGLLDREEFLTHVKTRKCPVNVAFNYCGWNWSSTDISVCQYYQRILATVCMLSDISWLLLFIFFLQFYKVIYASFFMYSWHIHIFCFCLKLLILIQFSVKFTLFVKWCYLIQ